MGWQLWQDVAGPLLSSPHTWWPIWSGGGPTIILSDLTRHCELCSCNRASEGAAWWRNATGSEHRRWRPGEPTDDGRHARCSPTPCHRFPLERHASLMGKCHVAGRVVKVPAEEVGWGLTPGSGGLSGLPTDEKQP